MIAPPLWYLQTLLNEKLYFLLLSENITFISMFIINDNVLCILFKFLSINVRKFTSQTN